MFDEPEESPEARHVKPADRAKEKSDEFRMHAELCAIFEGCRKFDAQIRPNLDAEIARQSQKTMGRLEKAKSADIPVLPEPVAKETAGLLDLPAQRDLATNDYHIYRRPGEVMIVRWLQGDEVEAFYTRLQAHFDAALTQHREEERHAQGWKQDANTLAYLAALDAIDVRMADKYLRDVIRKHNVFVLSTQSADEMDILHLCDFVMGVDPAEVVGQASAPPDQPTEQDRAWFSKIFSLRGMHEGQERMCFFTYLQKSDEGDSL